MEGCNWFERTTDNFCTQSFKKLGTFINTYMKKYYNSKCTTKNVLSLQKIFYFFQAVSDPTGNFIFEPLSIVHFYSTYIRFE
jgi:hypothetical protein